MLGMSDFSQVQIFQGGWCKGLGVGEGGLDPRSSGITIGLYSEITVPRNSGVAGHGNTAVSSAKKTRRKLVYSIF